MNELSKMIKNVSYRRSNWEVFADFVEMAAISLSNGIDRLFPGERYRKREERYLQIIKKYEPKEIQAFPEMLGWLVNEFQINGINDVLGKTYHDLELHNKWAGQYFTPFEICRLMSKMTVGTIDQIPECGFITAMEPACGSGAMVLAMAADMKDSADAALAADPEATVWSYQRNLHVTAVDVDAKCCHMAYIQFSLLHIPAVIVHGNSLSLEEWDHWQTPAHVLGLWDYKLRRRQRVLTETSTETALPELPAIAAVAAAAGPTGQLSLF